MRKGVIESLSGQDEFGNATHAVVHPIETPEAHWDAIIPWHLRGETGKGLKKGDSVVFESFVDGTAYIAGRFDGETGHVLYGDPLKLGDASASDFVALARKVEDALGEIQSKFNSHKHAFIGQGTVQLPDTQLWPLPDPDPEDPTKGGPVPSVASEKVKAK